MKGPHREDEPTHNLTQRELTVSEKYEPLTRRLRSGLLFVTVAREDGEARVFGETRIGDGEIAEDENGFAVRFGVASVDTVSAETGASSLVRSALILFHRRSIAQDAVFALAGDSRIGVGPACRTPWTVIEVESP
jgi:hypothetical protein